MRRFNQAFFKEQLNKNDALPSRNQNRSEKNKTESTQGYCSFMAATNSYLGYRVVCTSSRYDFLLKNNNNNNNNNNKNNNNNNNN